MQTLTRINNIKILAAVLFLLGLTSLASAVEFGTGNQGYLVGGPSASGKEVDADKPAKADQSKKATLKKKLLEKGEENLTEFQIDARAYRAQGLEAQRIGDLDRAMTLYQKAIELDPAYAVAYNDLGIIYEANGFLDRAEASYLKATKVDPGFLSAYSNLASVYETKRDLKKAAIYWRKRAELGDPDDLWTQKAQDRLNDINLVLGNPIEDMRERDVVDLMNVVELNKQALRKDNKTLAKDKLRRAQVFYQKGDEVSALKTAIDAGQLDEDNDEITAFIEKIQSRLLSK